MMGQSNLLDVHDDSRTRSIAWVMTVIGFSLHFLLSAQALLRLGIPYDAPFGSPAAKVHPGSYILILAFLLMLSSYGHPFRAVGALLLRQKLISVFFCNMVLVFFWVLFRHGTSGAAFIIETLWMPAIAAYLVSMLDQTKQRKVFVMLMLLLVANAVLAIGESFLKQRLIPLTGPDSEVVAEEFFRSSAFLGHPLENALVTATLLPALMLLPWSLASRCAMVGLMLLALFAFGGRSGLAITMLVYGSLLAWHVVKNTVRGRYSYVQLVGGMLVVMLGTAALMAVVTSTGLGDRILNNMTWDNSASVRTKVLDSLDYLNTSELWFGISASQIDLVKLKLGLDPRYEAIENYWIYLLMNFGIVAFSLFVTGIAALVYYLFHQASTPLRAAILVYFVVSSGANTLAAKTSSLMFLVAVVMTSTALFAYQRTHGWAANRSHLQPRLNLAKRLYR